LHPIKKESNRKKRKGTAGGPLAVHFHGPKGFNSPLAKEVNMPKPKWFTDGVKAELGPKVQKLRSELKANQGLLEILDFLGCPHSCEKRMGVEALVNDLTEAIGKYAQLVDEDME
jgi:hypothetical protein